MGSGILVCFGIMRHNCSLSFALQPVAWIGWVWYDLPQCVCTSEILDDNYTDQWNHCTVQSVCWIENMLTSGCITWLICIFCLDKTGWRFKHWYKIWNEYPVCLIFQDSGYYRKADDWTHCEELVHESHCIIRGLDPLIPSTIGVYPCIHVTASTDPSVARYDLLCSFRSACLLVAFTPICSRLHTEQSVAIKRNSILLLPS